MAELCADWELIGELTGTVQLSSPAMVLSIYSVLTGMVSKELKEHLQGILREKYVPGTPREETMEVLRIMYGDEFIQAVKSESKKEADNER